MNMSVLTGVLVVTMLVLCFLIICMFCIVRRNKNKLDVSNSVLRNCLCNDSYRFKKCFNPDFGDDGIFDNTDYLELFGKKFSDYTGSDYFCGQSYNASFFKNCYLHLYNYKKNVFHLVVNTLILITNVILLIFSGIMTVIIILQGGDEFFNMAKIPYIRETIFKGNITKLKTYSRYEVPFQIISKQANCCGYFLNNAISNTGTKNICEDANFYYCIPKQVQDANAVIPAQIIRNIYAVENLIGHPVIIEFCADMVILYLEDFEIFPIQKLYNLTCNKNDYRETASNHVKTWLSAIQLLTKH